ncbi:MAG: 23S rRNA (uracil(1939)-C(5))-methyltransferase RlmD [Candidatus Omnitrophota bacterium]|nr:MAG: 23S rRNA (uracil(1939)-C(5))-methyltransferase RlmD [Candidatus Omnitrophota bacterium]RKY35791.1 MAG: 23S rRNA (uracil(1939)-C(5))-methyltransferase RlmD [Candidatus Omnitrophota bacterium]RKY44815.1 MAG: 23S rRNA (uracil(1939)-C(5))-methyltransferase RlmD [Candidatus Omnitrophota bacterium]
MSPTKFVCKHFGVCGGCRFQDLEYPEQLERKQKFLGSLFSPLKNSPKILPIIPSPKIYFYRNKMEFSFAQEASELVCGLHSRLNKRKVIDVEECFLFSENVPLVLEKVKDLLRKERLSSYSTFSHRGFLRYLVLRESKTKNDFMVNIVTTSEGSLDKEAFKSALISLRLKDNKRITSLVWTISDKLSDAVVPEKFEVFYGQDYLEEEIKGFKFRIPAFSFFQVNPFILEVFFEFIKTHLKGNKENSALDLFSGVGSLSLLLAKEFSFVWAIEQDELAIKTSLVNASLNNINNVSFLNSDVKKALFLNLNLWKERIFLVFINPPRAGLSKKIIKRIKTIAPKRIIYSSCNPKSFIVDLQSFLDSYRIRLIQPFDFFPHTPHIEVLALLERR